MKPVYKAGSQSNEDPFEFVMSTSARDRAGDIVEQDWDLSAFRQNPIALFGHDHRSPIGVWENVRVSKGRLIGRLKLAERGTSQFIDELRSLVEQRILKAVSVGFRPGKVKAIDEDDPFAGLRLSDNELLETSLVAVGMNSQALSTAKSLALEAGMRVETDTDESPACAASQLGMRRAVSRARDSDPQPEKKRMSLSKRIEAAQGRVKTLTDSISDLEENMGEVVDTDDLEKMQALTEELKVAEKALGTLEETESVLKRRLKADVVADEKGSAGETRDEVRKHARIELRSTKPKGWAVMRGFACLLSAHGSSADPRGIAKSSARDNPEVEAFVRAAVDPATMADPAWAGELVQETWGEFVALLRDLSVYPQLLGPRMSFDRFGKITLPRQQGRGTLAGGFVGEGSPIPVKAGVLDNVTLEPKGVKVISTFTKELQRHSIPQIQTVINDQILGDTAEVLDSYVTDSGARTSDRPAGFQDPTETGAGNIVASTGFTVAAIEADITSLLTRVYTARVGNTGQWLMNRNTVLKLDALQDAASGVFVYRDQLSNGMFKNYPVVTSMNLPLDTLFFVAGQSLAHGDDYAPEISVSDQATLHMDDAPSGDLGGATTDVRSMFQTDSVAIKMALGLDWRIYRTGGIQVLTGFA